MDHEVELGALLTDACNRAQRYLAGLDERAVAPHPGVIESLGGLDEPFPEEGSPASEVLRRLDELGSPATTATVGGRYFGFVVGGVLPAALAADWLTSTWDQNAGMRIVSPIAATLEEVAGRWVLEALGLPRDAAVGFVTGATAGNLSGLAAARHALLARAGYDVERDGLFDAPPIQVVVGDEVHVSVRKALGILGLGRERVLRVPTDEEGAMRADRLPPLDDRTIVCLQAGNVNTGAFDPAAAIIAKAREAGAWVHVDGAFGLWALASPSLAPLAEGYQAADSWSTDAHKWLNVPYDSGLVICRDADALRGALGFDAAYLVDTGGREPAQLTPELSRRARGLPVWAALASLGRSGLRELVERSCRQARRFAEVLRGAGYTIPNKVVLNQVLVELDTPEQLAAVLKRVQEEGIAWFGGTTWHGRPAVRISVSSWCTTDEDVEKSAAALSRAIRG